MARRWFPSRTDWRFFESPVSGLQKGRTERVADLFGSLRVIVCKSRLHLSFNIKKFLTETVRVRRAVLWTLLGGEAVVQRHDRNRHADLSKARSSAPALDFTRIWHRCLAAKLSVARMLRNGRKLCSAGAPT